MKDGMFFTKSQVVKNYPITDFVTWVDVVFVVFLPSSFLIVSAELEKWGGGRVRFEHHALEGKEARHTND